jgi:hypothetical protein
MYLCTHRFSFFSLDIDSAGKQMSTMGREVKKAVDQAI